MNSEIIKSYWQYCALYPSITKLSHTFLPQEHCPKILFDTSVPKDTPYPVFLNLASNLSVNTLIKQVFHFRLPYFPSN